MVPGAHYSCGGVSTDVYGRTELAGLFAAGEVARTGMHGANRLASNSLLEGLVVGGRAGRVAAAHAASSGSPVAEIDVVGREALDRPLLQRAMTRWASVVRDADGLGDLAAALGSAPAAPMNTRADFEDAALTATARVVAAAALARTESRGCHHRRDYAETDPAQALSLTEHARSGSARPAMRLTDDELAEAVITIRRGLDEDLRYGPDITTLATVPEDAQHHSGIGRAGSRCGGRRRHRRYWCSMRFSALAATASWIGWTTAPDCGRASRCCGWRPTPADC